MNKPYLIIFDYSLLEKNLVDVFVEAIRSTYVSKKIDDNLYVISSSETDPEIVYNGVHKKMSEKVNFLVVEFENFYGDITVDLDWFRETFPSIELTSTSDDSLQRK